MSIHEGELDSALSKTHIKINKKSPPSGNHALNAPLRSVAAAFSLLPHVRRILRSFSTPDACGLSDGGEGIFVDADFLFCFFMGRVGLSVPQNDHS